jgi:hypothetical protein
MVFQTNMYGPALHGEDETLWKITVVFVPRFWDAGDTD